MVALAEGARVQDALDAAGGLTKRATPGQLNLAAPVNDGSQLVIGRKGSQVRATSPTAGAEPGAPARWTSTLQPSNNWTPFPALDR